MPDIIKSIQSEIGRIYPSLFEIRYELGRFMFNFPYDKTTDMSDYIQDINITAHKDLEEVL